MILSKLKPKANSFDLGKIIRRTAATAEQKLTDSLSNFSSSMELGLKKLMICQFGQRVMPLVSFSDTIQGLCSDQVETMFGPPSL